MAQETLQLIITADNKEALKAIEDLAKSTKGLKTQFQSIAGSSGQATQALTNLSRVAQDAPYGFMGIANNINPLLESFQRLQASSGSTGSALKAMAAGLMGPAGLGLAVGAVSSIIVAFGPTIANYIKGVNAASEADKKFADSLDKAKASANESGLKLLAYIGIAEDVTIADNKRANALKFVVSELSKVNKAYASNITTTQQAKAAVELYTQSLVAQAITSRYVDELANKYIDLEKANKKILQTGREYYATLESTKTAINGYADASVYQASAISKAKDANIDARNEALNLRSSIISLKTSLNDVVKSAAENPFNTVTNGAKELTKASDNATKSVDKLYKQARTLKISTTQIIEQPNFEPTLNAPPSKLPMKLPSFAADYEAKQEEKSKENLDAYNQKLQFANQLSGELANGFTNVFDAMVSGESAGAALEQMFKNLALQLTQMVIQALLFKAIMSAFGLGAVPTGGGGGFLGKILGLANGGIVTKPTFAMVGEGGESEAVMPLSKLDALMGNAFASGANSGGGNGQFVLRGQDLLLSVNRAQKASNLKGQNISLI